MSRKIAVRSLAGMFAGILCLSLAVSDAQAQGSSCSRLNSSLRTFERNSDFRNMERNDAQARQLAADLQNAESAYVRTGCNAAAKAGQILTRECQNLARVITRGRTDYAALSRKVETGRAIAQQREAVLQEVSRFGCGGGGNSSVTITQQQTGRGGLFDQLFGGYTTDGQPMESDIVGDEFSGYSGYATVRSVCVRLADGYFWPISFSTLPDFLGNDSATCQQQCPGAAVDLFYYNNPGQEAEDMRNMSGQPYSSLPNAFRYRREFDRSVSCKVKPVTGLTTIAGGDMVERSGIQFDGQTIPLPLRDPRLPPASRAAEFPAAPLTQPTQPNVIQAALEPGLNIPLPRRRPGSGDPTIAQKLQAPVSTSVARVVMFGDKKVRIVGPQTPYAQEEAAGL